MPIQLVSILNPTATGGADGGNILAVPGTTNASTGTVVFGSGGGVEFALSSGTMSASIGAHQATDNHPRLSNVLGTGLISGGILSVNGGDATKFDITAGVGVIVNNYTDGSSPTRTLVTWSAQTAITNPYVATADTAYVLVNSAGTIVITDTYPELADNRDFIMIGWTDHPGRTDIETIFTQPYYSNDVSCQLDDFLFSFGSFNVWGNEYDPYSGLQIERLPGATFEVGSNYTQTKKSPNVIETDLEQPASLIYFYRDGVGDWVNDSAPVASIDPNYYDDNSGTLAAVPAGKWTVQLLSFYAPMETNDIQYGQTYYDTLEEAITGVNDGIELNPYNDGWDTYRAWLIVKQGETNLNSADTVFITLGKFGLQDISVGAGASATTAANVGTAGEGIYHAKVGGELQFRKINSLDNKVSISYNSAATEVRVGIVPGNIDLSDIGSSSRVMATGERANYFYTSANTFANSTHSHGNPTLYLTNILGTTASASNGLSLSLSVSPGGAGDGVNIIAAGGSTANTTGTIVFSNSNGVSFGLNGATVTAAHNAITTARASNDAIGLNTALTANGVAWTVNSSGLSLNVPAFLTTAMLSNLTSNYMSTAERNNYFFTSNNTLANSTHSHGNPTLALTNILGTTASASNGLTISLSINPGGAGDGVNIVQMGAGGNSVGATYSASTGTVHLFGGDNITLSQNNNSITVSAAAPGGGAGMQFLSSANVQLNDTSHSSLGQNSIWMMPFRITGGSVSASTAQFGMSFTGTITSATTQQWGQTLLWGLYSAVNSTSFNSMSTGSLTMQVWASGTSSNSWAFQGTTSSSAASNLLITQIMGLRYFQVTLNSNLGANDYLFAFGQSTSSAGYASMIRTANHLIVNPMPVAMASWGSQTNNSIGLGQACRFSTTSGGLPATVNPVAALQVSLNAVPYIKIGAVQ
jgi:hypothetical protein